MIIEIANLNKDYKGKRVVNDLSFTVAENEAFALLGSNGAGKSTTIKIILGLVKANSGSVHTTAEKVIGYSPETPSFPSFLNGAEVLTYYAKLQGIAKAEIKDTVAKLLEVVGLEIDRTKVKFYSKGMLQRLALAQALLGNPDILLLDEPCAGLDAMGRIEMIELLKRLKKQGKTIIINSHILSDIEKVCDRGIIMSKGQVMRKWSQDDIGADCTLEDIFIQTLGGAI
ncbi:MAG: ABC transporter ATP-binding protein [Lachnospiraceae bacterium]